MAWYYLEQFSRISDGHPYPFYPEVPPPPPPPADQLPTHVSAVHKRQDY